MDFSLAKILKLTNRYSNFTYLRLRCTIANSFKNEYYHLRHLAMYLFRNGKVLSICGDIGQ